MGYRAPKTSLPGGKAGCETHAFRSHFVWQLCFWRIWAITSLSAQGWAVTVGLVSPLSMSYPMASGVGWPQRAPLPIPILPGSAGDTPVGGHCSRASCSYLGAFAHADPST